MFLSAIEQQQNQISGTFSGLQQTGPFKGTITKSGEITFLVYLNALQEKEILLLLMAILTLETLWEASMVTMLVVINLLAIGVFGSLSQLPIKRRFRHVGHDLILDSYCGCTSNTARSWISL